MPTAPIPHSPSARQPKERSTAASGGLGEDERVALTTDGSVAVPEATARAAGSSGAEAGATDVTPVFETEGPAVPKEQAALPKAMKGVVGHSIWPLSPQVHPPSPR